MRACERFALICARLRRLDFGRFLPFCCPDAAWSSRRRYPPSVMLDGLSWAHLADGSGRGRRRIRVVAAAPGESTLAHLAMLSLDRVLRRCGTATSIDTPRARDAFQLMRRCGHLPPGVRLARARPQTADPSPRRGSPKSMREADPEDPDSTAARLSGAGVPIEMAKAIAAAHAYEPPRRPEGPASETRSSFQVSTLEQQAGRVRRGDPPRPPWASALAHPRAGPHAFQAKPPEIEPGKIAQRLSG